MTITTATATTPFAGKTIYQGILQPRGFPGLPEGWVSEWETFASSDSELQLFMASHHPTEWASPKALIVLHGMGEHGGRYLHFPHFLKGDVGAVFCLDHRGHGRSEGLRGHAASFDLFVEDAALAIRRVDEQLRKRFGRSEIHLFGHSMGGHIALRTALLHPNLPIRSLTVSAPLLGIKVPLPLAKRAGARVLSRVWSTLQMASEIDPSLVSHDTEVVEAYKADRLVHKKGTPRLYTELLAAIEDTMGRDSGISVPLQMLVPMRDQIVDPEAALSFFRNLKLRDKQLKTYPNFFHESFNEIGKEQAFEDLRAWINQHSATAQAAH
jgi:alpha-beta hydrolase superfamily lysophospholipase